MHEDAVDGAHLLRALSSLDMPELYPSIPARKIRAPRPMAMFLRVRVLTAKEDRDTKSASSIAETSAQVSLGVGKLVVRSAQGWA